jgi:carboxymethylenebutenolidase
MHTTEPRVFRTIAAFLVSVMLVAACGGGGSGSSPAVEPAPQAKSNTVADPGASAAGSNAPDRAVISESLPYAEVGDELVYGYFVAPSDMFEPLPAVIMIHEWWGLNDNVRAAADRLAAEGYIVLAVDLFAGKTATTPSAARKLMLTVVEDPGAANENILSAYNFVSNTAGAPTVAALGWRFGGTWSLNAAMLLPDDLDASVIYYGAVTDDEDALRPVSTPILGLFAGDDISVSVDSVVAFETALKRLRKDYEIRIYEGVRQGFANQTADNFDAGAANDAWKRTLDFLQRHMGNEAGESDAS